MFEVWIASHFHNQLRFQVFEETVKSLAAQTAPPSCVRISWSAEIDADVAALFQRHFDPIGVQWKSYHQPERCAQFEHLKHIAAATRGERITWIAFCDDDDLYHPERLAVFEKEVTSNPHACVLFDHLQLVDGLRTYKEAMLAYRDGKSQTYADFGNYVTRRVLLEMFLLKWEHDAKEHLSPHMVDLYWTVWLSCNFELCRVPGKWYYKRNSLFVEGFCSWSGS